MLSFIIYNVPVLFKKKESSKNSRRGRLNKLLGELLVEGGYITLGQLNEVRRKQMGQSEAKLGDLLIENGLITREQLELALRMQSGKRQDQGLSSWA
jgi:hypothetical protein